MLLELIDETTLSNSRGVTRGDVVRKAIVSVFILLLLFCNKWVTFAENSAMFLVNIMPPSAQAGKKIIFLVRIRNTGTESWTSGEYSAFVKIFDENKGYITETNKIPQFKDIAPGEILAANIAFDIPVEYSGTYYYIAGIDFDTEILFSHYLTLKISPFIPTPEIKKWAGSAEIDYQDDRAIESTTNLTLRLVNMLSQTSFLELSASGFASRVIDPQLNNFLISYRSKKLDISAGDLTTGLSRLTLSRSRCIKVEKRLGWLSMAGLVGSSQKKFENDLYGIRGSISLTRAFEIGTNYVQRKRDGNSVASVDAEFGLSSRMTFKGEYASSVYKENEKEPERREGDAFQLSASLAYEKLMLDTSYEKVAQDFTSVGNPFTPRDYEQYDLSLTHFLSNYINGTIHYYKYHIGLSQDSDSLITSTVGGELTVAFPKLPSLLLTYSLDETYSRNNGKSFIKDTSDNLTLGFSYPMGKARVSANYLRFGYKDASEIAINETNESTNYGLWVPWGRRTTLSANYAVSSGENSTYPNVAYFQSITLGIRYCPSLRKLVLSPQYKVILPDSQQERKTTTSFGLTYYFTNKSVLTLSYGLTNYGEIINSDKAISDKFSINLNYNAGLGKNDKLELNYSFDTQRNFTAIDNSTPNENSSLRLIYKIQI